MSLPELRAALAAAIPKFAEPPTRSTVHMEAEERYASVGTMIGDLWRLATEDGCIAAGWALEKLLALHPDEPAAGNLFPLQPDLKAMKG